MQLYCALLICAAIILCLIRRVKVHRGAEDISDKQTPFIEPNEISDLEDIFRRDRKEYVFINYPVDYFAASVLCNMSYKGRLAFIETVELANFLAEALSETNLIMEVLWVGAKLINETWFWNEGEIPNNHVDQMITDLFVNYSGYVPSDERTCLALGRTDHDVPHFATLKCTVLRPFMCERHVRGSGNGSTHHGWIKIDNRLYKIFQDQVSWIDARAKCVENDRESRLAVLVNFLDSQQLGRHLLIGRPSLENAWIGANYYNNYYRFEQENRKLDNISDAGGYPPWRNNIMKKIGGCILLDRHLSNITYFVEARCERLRPYICYKMDTKKEGQDRYTDILIEEFGYRSYVTEFSWDKARDKCNSYPKEYEGILAEIRERRILFHLIYVMGENKTAFQHIWLGGILHPVTNKWCWNSDLTLIDSTVLNWLSNTSYYENIEQFNTCLNMDRENHLHAMHYGAHCEYPQNFVCMFRKY